MNKPSPFERYGFVLRSVKVSERDISDLLLVSKWNSTFTRSLIPLFRFHTLYKAEFKALSTSIIKAIYTTNKTAIYRNTHNLQFLCDFVCFSFSNSSIYQQLEVENTVKGGRLVQLLTATDDQ